MKKSKILKVMKLISTPSPDFVSNMDFVVNRITPLLPRLRFNRRFVLLLMILGPVLVVAEGRAQSAPAPMPGSLTIDINGGDNPEDFGVIIQLLFIMTLLTLAPSIVMLMTSFTRIVIVLGFVRNALGVQNAPNSQIIVGLALFLTFFLMAPVWESIYEEGIKPYNEKQISSKEALDRSSTYMKVFMIRQTRDSDINFFLGLSGMGPTTSAELPMRIVVPSFVLSELRTAFQMGFLIFIPFLIIDFLVASTLMAMGMMMMPPAIVSLPFKLLLFVLVDGWYLIMRSIVESFSI